PEFAGLRRSAAQGREAAAAEVGGRTSEGVGVIGSSQASPLDKAHLDRRAVSPNREVVLVIESAGERLDRFLDVVRPLVVKRMIPGAFNASIARKVAGDAMPVAFFRVQERWRRRLLDEPEFLVDECRGRTRLCLG